MVSMQDRDYLLIGTEILSHDKAVTDAMSQYVLQFGAARQRAALLQEGLLPKKATRPIERAFVTDERTFREALNLRKLAYEAEGKTHFQQGVPELSDLYDARSRILVCRTAGRAVATARLAFPQYGDRTEHEEYISWPSGFPRRDQIVEVTRACTHPEFRRGGVFFSLLRSIVVTAMQAGRPWVVTSSTEDLVSMYDWIGLKPCGLAYIHTGLNNLPHQVLIANIPAALTGASVSAGAWYAVWKDALPYLEGLNESRISPIRSVFYSTFGAVSAFVNSWRRF